MSDSITVMLFGRKTIAAELIDWIMDNGSFNLLGVVTDSHLQESPTAAAALRRSVPILSHSQVEAGLRDGSLRPDLGLSVLYWRKFSSAMLMESSPYGLINFHPAPLPDFKGCGGYNFAILEGRRDWATTAHYVDASIDTGPIIDVAHLPVDPASDTAASLERRTLASMAFQVRATLQRVVAIRGRLPTTPNVGGRYITRREMLSAMEVRPGDDVSLKARAFFFPPHEGAWVTVNGVRCTLLTAELLSHFASYGSTDRQAPH